MVLCDLQGGILTRGRGAVLTDPVILSRTRSYGVTDLGPDGISTFFARHVCSQYCQAHWHKPRATTTYYSCAASTTMELPVARHPQVVALPFYQAAIYEDDEDYSDSDDY